MKNLLFFIALTALLLAGESYGQELEPKKNANGKYGFVDETDKVVIPCKYDFVSYFSEGLAMVRLNGKAGFIDKIGKEVITLKYDNAWSFSEGMALVKLKSKCGFIDKTGKEVIPLKYDDAWSFSEGLSVVERSNKYGLIDKTGKEVIPLAYNTVDKVLKEKFTFAKFSEFAKKYVEVKISEWQKKGEFEKTADWQKRVTETNRKAKAAELVKEAEQEFIAKFTKDLYMTLGEYELGEYDPDNEVYLIRSDKYGNLLVPVPIAEAQAFKAEWFTLLKTSRYFIENDNIALASVAFSTSNGKTYTYSNKASLSYSVAKIDYNFAPIEVNIADNSSSPKGNQSISTVNLSAGTSEVDVNIPAKKTKNENTFAVIIANENYQEAGVSQVDFALNDGTIFKEYCIKTLGLPAQNIHYRANATLNNIRTEVNWLRQVAEKYRGDAKIIFYYAGHGIPDEKSQTSYLLPVDGTDVASAYKLDDLYQTLGNMPAKSVVIFMDACFSGAGRDESKMVAQAQGTRGVAIKAKPGVPMGNMVVFASSQSDETSLPYREKGHGLFTYFLLKKLQETKGNVTLVELENYLTTHVGRQSVVINSKGQTPTATPSRTLGFAWEDWKLK
jgi:hypothetical protein